MKGVIVDTGPLVALLNRRDKHHPWAHDVLTTVQQPMHTCEAVLTEACFLLRRIEGAADAVLDLVAKGVVSVDFRLGGEASQVRKLMARYADMPMAFADACLVRMTELDAAATVLTLDTDFRVYRKHGRQAVPAILPE
jgi:uncharacterized protein